MATLPHLKRGGQPGNRNALRHGLYSINNPHSRLAFSRLSPQPTPAPRQRPALLPSSSPLDVRLTWIATLEGLLDENRHKLCEILVITRRRLPFKEMCVWLRLASNIVGANLKAIRGLDELRGCQGRLFSLAVDLPVLLDWEFARLGVPAQPVFVPQELENFHANVDWRFPHLTDAQWLLLRELFLSLHEKLDSTRKYRRRKPLPSDRFLLEGILYKLAGALRWQDLQGRYPVRRCQDFYHLLCRAGVMQAIFDQLYWHLDVHGSVSLRQLVLRGCFVIDGNRVCLSPSEPPTWEKYTALLLLQQACCSRRSMGRLEDLERRRQGRYYRLSYPNFRLFSPVEKEQL